MDVPLAILSAMKILLVVTTAPLVFYRGVQLLIRHEEFRIRTFALALMFGEVGISLYLAFSEAITIFRMDPILVNGVASTSIALGVLLTSMTFIFLPKEPRKSIIVSILIGTLVGFFMGATLSRMAQGKIPFYFRLLVGDVQPVEIRELISGFILIACGILILRKTMKNLLHQLSTLNSLKSELNLFIFSMAEIGSGVGILLFGGILIFRNDVLFIFFQLAAAVVLVALALISWKAKEPRPVPFTSYLKLKNDLLSSNSQLGWVLHVFGQMGPEPYLSFTNNLQDLSNRERIEFIMEMGIKFMSLMTFGDRIIRSSVKIDVQEPFKGTILYVGKLGRTETLENEFDVRFEGRPYVGFMFIIRNESTWMFDKAWLWEQFFETLSEQYLIEELSVEIINQEILTLLYSIIAA